MDGVSAPRLPPLHPSLYPSTRPPPAPNPTPLLIPAPAPALCSLPNLPAQLRGPLAPGMVVTVEPGAYLIPPLLAKARADPKVAPFINFDLAESLAAGGLGGVRIEDNVLLLDGSKGARAGAGTGAGAGVSGGVSGAGVQGRLFNLTVAAGCAKEMREVEDVMAEEWRPAEAMSRVVG